MSLRLDWCSYKAAKYACENWHYSGTMPPGKLVKVGVWEDGSFIGAVVFGRGANNNIGLPYRLGQDEVCELVRVALRQHKSPVSRIVAISFRLLRALSPGLRMIISYADPAQGHNGSIYQAGNWIYSGRTKGGTAQIKFPDGRIIHKRTIFSRFGTGSAQRVGGIYFMPEEKHKYLYPLDKEMRERILPLAKPYPKRAGSIEADAPAIHAGEGSSTLTPAL